MPESKIAMSTKSLTYLVNDVQCGTPAQCPFHAGAATLDLLLAQLDPHETELFDATLDLRTLAVARYDAAACIAQLFRVRRLLAGRHYLAFYRVRSWAKRSFRIEVRPHRNEAWQGCEFAVDCGNLDEAVNTALATLARNNAVPAGSHARIVFRTA